MMRLNAKFFRTLCWILGSLIIIAAGITRMYYSDKAFSASLVLDSAMTEKAGFPSKVLTYSTNKADFRLSYHGQFRDRPVELNWSEASRLRQEIAAKCRPDDPSTLRELMGVSIAVGYADQYAAASHMVTLAYCLLALALAILLCGFTLTVKALLSRRSAGVEQERGSDVH